MIAVWYLVITGYNTGAVVIPQASQQQCVANMHWIEPKHGLRPSYYYLNALCVPGVK